MLPDMGRKRERKTGASVTALPGNEWHADAWASQLEDRIFAAAWEGDRARYSAVMKSALAALPGLPGGPDAETIKQAAREQWKNVREIVADAARSKQDEAAAADGFAEEYAGAFAYDPRRRAWRRFEGGIWRPAYGEAVSAMREIAPQLRKRNTVYGALTLAGAALEVLAWNRPGYLAFPGGHIDLESGEVLRADAPEIYHTRHVPVPAADVPEEWLRFVQHGLLARYRTLAARRDIEAWLQAWAYGALAGALPRFEKFVFLQGPPGSGKSTFSDALRAAFAGHAGAVAGEYLASATRAHRAWLAGQHDKRLVIVSEIPARRAAWQSADLNALVSGEPMQVQFMRQDFFDMQYRGGLLVHGNSRPAASPGSGVWRRMALIETVPAARKDTGLKERLEGMAGGVLAWALAGRAAFDSGVLAELPKALRAGVIEYQDSEDVLGQWLAERCTTGQDCTERAKVLLDDFNRWREGNELRRVSATAFGRQLAERRYSKRNSHVIWYDGLQLRERPA